MSRYAAEHFAQAEAILTGIALGTDMDKLSIDVRVQIASVHAKLAEIRGFAAAGMANDMIPAERKAWQELLGTDQPTPDDAYIPEDRTPVTGRTNTARPARGLDQQIENALSGLFDADVAADIRASEAYGALRYRIGSYIAMHPDRDPAYILGYLLDAGTRNFAAVADNPAAYLAKQISELR